MAIKIQQICGNAMQKNWLVKSSRCEGDHTSEKRLKVFQTWGNFPMLKNSLDRGAAFGGATSVERKAISPTDPAARYTASANSAAGYAYSDNYLINLKHAVIMDVEATTAIRQAEVAPS
jgi:hypothetical protein